MSLKMIFSVSCIVVALSIAFICILHMGWLMRKVRGFYRTRSEIPLMTTPDLKFNLSQQQYPTQSGTHS